LIFILDDNTPDRLEWEREWLSRDEEMKDSFESMAFGRDAADNGPEREGSGRTP
jgi:hypothetical protein